MRHLTEEELILHYYGETAGDEGIESHLSTCASCRDNYNALRLVLNTVDAATVPERGTDYGERVWRRIQGRVGRRRMMWVPRWWMLVPAAAALMTVAFIAGRLSRPPAAPQLASSSQVRERILLVAVGDHLDRSQMVLAELSNAPEGKGKGKIDISSERNMAEDLLDDNRLYRLTAHSAGDDAMASVLDDLERVLMEIAHSPSEVSSDQLMRLQQEIEERGLLFKVRVVGSQVRQRDQRPLRPAAPGPKNNSKL